MQAPRTWPPLEIWSGLTDYTTASARQEAEVAKILQFSTPEKLIFCEHPSVATLGTSATAEEVLSSSIKVISTNRGGKTTVHEPGQRVIYPIMNLTARGKDLRQYVHNLQRWVIDSLRDVGVTAYADTDVGVWVKTADKEEKIAAIGVRVRRWVAFHGVAINVENELEGFRHVVPCGIRDKGVTSLKKLGLTITIPEFDAVLLRHFATYFPPLESHEQSDQSGR